MGHSGERHPRGRGTEGRLIELLQDPLLFGQGRGRGLVGIVSLPSVIRELGRLAQEGCLGKGRLADGPEFALEGQEGRGEDGLGSDRGGEGDVCDCEEGVGRERRCGRRPGDGDGALEDDVCCFVGLDRVLEGGRGRECLVKHDLLGRDGSGESEAGGVGCELAEVVDQSRVDWEGTQLTQLAGWYGRGG